MPTEFTHGFRRGWENNKELVGGNFPAEQADFKFDDQTSYTQVRTKNGFMEWVDLDRGGQRIMFTRFSDMTRYILQDPPSNKFVEIPSPGKQDPDTGAAIGTTSHSSGGVIGPEPPPTKPEPKPPSNELRISEFAGGATLGQESQADIDAQSRITDEIRKRGGNVVVTYDVKGRHLLRPWRLDVPGVQLRSIEKDRTWLVADPKTPGDFLVGWQEINDVTVDGSADRYPPDRMEGRNLILFHRKEQKSYSATITNFPFLGFASADGSEDCEIRNPTIIGLSPGGWFKTGRGWTAFFGVWSSNRSKRLKIIGGSIQGCGLNGAFLSGQSERMEGTKLFDNHHAWNEDNGQRYGGGQICAAGVDGYFSKLVIGPSDAGVGPSGLELDGDRQTVEDCKTFGHSKATGIVCQRGKHTLRRNESYQNRVGLAIENESRDSSIPLSGPDANRIHDNSDDDIYRAK